MQSGSIDETLRKARQVEERYKAFMERKTSSDKSIEETLKKIDKAQSTLKQTRQTIGQVDDIYTKMQKRFEDAIDSAVKMVEQSTMATAAEPGFEPNHTNPKQVAQHLISAKKILVLTGAGMSAASGIPTFRGKDGFWRKEKVEVDPNNPGEAIDPQIILTNRFYEQHPEITWQWLRQFYELKRKNKPNKGHIALSQIIQTLATAGKELCIVTQNIDNFHTEVRDQRLSKNPKYPFYPIYEIHGNIMYVRCDKCSNEKKELSTEDFSSYVDMLQMNPKIYCPSCQGLLRPHIMFFDEFYDQVFNQYEAVSNFQKQADAVVVIGTALQTGMANGIVQKACETQKMIIEINTQCQVRKKRALWVEKQAEGVLQQIRDQVKVAVKK